MWMMRAFPANAILEPKFISKLHKRCRKILEGPHLGISSPIAITTGADLWEATPSQAAMTNQTQNCSVLSLYTSVDFVKGSSKPVQNGNCEASNVQAGVTSCSAASRLSLECRTAKKKKKKTVPKYTRSSTDTGGHAIDKL